MILALRTDSPETYIGLWQDGSEIDQLNWESGRELSIQLMSKIDQLMTKNNQDLATIDGIIVYQGPGSYTGLRIGISAVNAIGYGIGCPVVATTSDDWINQGIAELEQVASFSPVTPEYGGGVHTTKPRK